MSACFDGLRVIPEEAFAGRDDLRRLVLPEGLEEIGDGAFSACVNLESLELPSTLRRIGEGAFMYCTSLRSVLLPPAVTEVGGMAFFGCASLRSAQIKNPACRLGTQIFGGYYPDPPGEEGSDAESALTEGRFPTCFPEGAEDAEILMYALLWCREREKPPFDEAAKNLKRNIDSAFAYLLRKRRGDLLEGLLREGLIGPDRFPAFIRAANEAGQPELAALLLHSAAQTRRSIDEEFSL